MRTCRKTKDIDVVILCGGRGRRLRSMVSDRPKPMAEFGNRPFLSMLMEYAAGFGFKRFIISIGYKSDFIREYYRNLRLPWQVVFSKERTPQGTGGAILRAEPFVHSNPFLVMNGDSCCRLNFKKFIDFHLKKKALLSIALTKSSHSKNKGRVSMDGSQRILCFVEKAGLKGLAFDSAGIYLMDKKVFSVMGKKRRFSLEYDFFPAAIGTGRCYGFKQPSACIDFGTVSGYLKARELFKKRFFRGLIEPVKIN